MIPEVHPAEEQRWNDAALAGTIALPALRVWRYDRPAVILGRAQRPDEPLLARARRAGVEVLERASGGGAVLVGPWLLGASIVLPPGHPLAGRNIAASYGWLGEIFVTWLHELGIAAGRLTALPVDGGSLRWACFAGRSHGEVEVDSRKIVGLAQARRRAGTLFAAGLLVDETPWERLVEVMGRPAEEAAALAARTISCAALGVAVEAGELARRVWARVARENRS